MLAVQGCWEASWELGAPDFWIDIFELWTWVCPNMMYALDPQKYPNSWENMIINYWMEPGATFSDKFAPLIWVIFTWVIPPDMSNTPAEIKQGNWKSTQLESSIYRGFSHIFQCFYNHFFPYFPIFRLVDFFPATFDEGQFVADPRICLTAGQKWRHENHDALDLSMFFWFQRGNNPLGLGNLLGML